MPLRTLSAAGGGDEEEEAGMKINGITIERRGRSGIGLASALIVQKRILTGPKTPRLVLLHELGHFFGEVKEESFGAQRARWMGYSGGDVGLEIIRSEAAAWRWAVKAWQRRGRALGAEEKRIIRGYFGSYLRHRWMTFSRQAKDGVVVQTRRVPAGRNPRSHSSAL
jgi:hypothetical protein